MKMIGFISPLFMAELGGTFDPSQTPPAKNDFDPIPAGEYLLQVVESEMKQTKAGTGQYLNIQFEVITGPYENRRIFQMFNVQNPSAEAQEIGQRQLADLCLATGAGAIKDSNELHFKPFTGKVGIKKDDEFGDKNIVRQFKTKNGERVGPKPVGKEKSEGDQASTGGAPAKNASDMAANRPDAAQKRPWANAG